LKFESYYKCLNKRFTLRIEIKF